MKNLIRYEQSVSASVKNLQNPFFSLEPDKTSHHLDRWFNLPTFSNKRFEELMLSPAIDLAQNKNKFKISN